MVRSIDWDKMVAESNGGARRKPRQEEHKLQCQCKRAFDLAHPALAPLLFAIPNGGARDERTGAMLKAEGVVAGVADMCLAVPRGGFGALYIEFKTPKGRQSDSQKAWQEATQAAGNRYEVVRDVDGFMDLVKDYLKQ